MATIESEVGLRAGWAPLLADPLDVFERERGTLHAIATRILGSARAGPTAPGAPGERPPGGPP